MIFAICIVAVVLINILFTRAHVVLNIALENRKADKNDVLNLHTAQVIDFNTQNKRTLKSQIKRVIIKFFNGDYAKGFIRWKLCILGKIPSHRFRKFILKYLYSMKIGKKAVIYGWDEIRNPWLITIGKGTIIGDNARLDGRGTITIGENVNFSTGVWIWTEQHDVNSPDFNGEHGAVIIKDRVWCSCRTIILPDVTIEEGSVIAAGAVVTKNCDSFGIYAGVPAKRIGERERNLRYCFSGSHLHFK
ncbi:MAG: acyltransferase [Acutalibacteraceae bacterium]